MGYLPQFWNQKTDAQLLAPVGDDHAWKWSSNKPSMHRSFTAAAKNTEAEKNCLWGHCAITSGRANVHHVHSCMSFMTYDVTGTKKGLQYHWNNRVLSVLAQAVSQARIFVCLFSQKTLNASNKILGSTFWKHCNNFINDKSLLWISLPLPALLELPPPAISSPASLPYSPGLPPPCPPPLKRDSQYY